MNNEVKTLSSTFTVYGKLRSITTDPATMCFLVNVLNDSARWNAEHGFYATADQNYEAAEALTNALYSVGYLER